MVNALEQLRMVWSDITSHHPDVTIIGAETETQDEETENVFLLRGVQVLVLDDDEEAPQVVIAVPVTNEWRSTVLRILGRMNHRKFLKNLQATQLEREVYGAEGFVDDKDSP